MFSTDQLLAQQTSWFESLTSDQYSMQEELQSSAHDHSTEAAVFDMELSPILAPIIDHAPQHAKAADQSSFMEMIMLNGSAFTSEAPVLASVVPVDAGRQHDTSMWVPLH